MCEHGDSLCKGQSGSSPADCARRVIVCGAQSGHTRKRRQLRQLPQRRQHLAGTAASRSHALQPILTGLRVLARTHLHNSISAHSVPSMHGNLYWKKFTKYSGFLALDKTTVLFTNLC